MRSSATVRGAARPSGFAIWSFFTIPNAEPGPVTGILGGTFDPVHRGHLSAATQLQAAGAAVREVWLMPNARPAHRAIPPVASPRDRLRMVELAVAGIEGLRSCALEVDRGGPSYTIDTWRELRGAFPDRRLALLLGIDAALQIQGWNRADALLEEASFIIFSRPAYSLPSGQLKRLGFPGGRTQQVIIETPPISARTVRARLAQGRPVDDMLDPRVLAFIRERGLYHPSGGMG